MKEVPVSVDELKALGITIGRRDTYGTEQVVFDLSELIETYGAGSAVLMVKRPSDETAYPAATTEQNETSLVWTVSEIDTAVKGRGECEVFWYVESNLAKSVIFPLSILRDIGETTEEPPDAYQTWVDTLTALGGETQENARQAAESAENAAQSAESAATSEHNAGQHETNSEVNALKAEGFAVGKQGGEAVGSGSPYYQNNAQYYAERAGTKATEAADAATDAVSAKTAAETARDDAISAKNDAVTAKETAVEAKNDAVAAKNAAVEARNNASDAAATATSKATEASSAAQTATTAAGNASRSETSASTDALKAEGYAVGQQSGTDVGSGSPYYQNNAKYYSEQAAGDADRADEAAEAAGQSSDDAEAAKDAAQEAQTAIEGMTFAAETLAPGSAVTVTKTIVSGFVHLLLGIPRGEQGEKGDSPSIEEYADLITDWLSEHITQPTTPIVDDSLSIDGAAADAAATGEVRDEITGIAQESTAAALLTLEQANTFLVGEFLGSLDGLTDELVRQVQAEIDNLPQDENGQAIAASLSEGNSWLSQLLREVPGTQE